MGKEIFETSEDYNYSEKYKPYGAACPALKTVIPTAWSIQFLDCNKVPKRLSPLLPGSPINLGCLMTCDCCCNGGFSFVCGFSPSPSSFVPSAGLVSAVYPLDGSGGCSSESVNLRSGNMTVHYPVVSFPTKGYPLEFSITYNSQGTFDTRYGYRWIGEIDRRIKIEDEGNTITITTETGTGYTYVRVGDGYKLDNYIDSNYHGTSSDWMNTSLTEGESYYIESTPGGKKFYYNKQNGAIQRVVDLAGNIVYYKFQDRSDRVRFIEDEGEGSRQRQITLDYDSYSGKLSKVTDPFGRQTGFYYKNTLLCQIVGPEGCVTTFDYDENFRIISKTNPNGGITYYSYDSDGRLISVTNPLGETTGFVYDFVIEDTPNFKAEVRITDPRQKVWKWQFNMGALLYNLIDPEGNLTRFIWNENNLMRVVEGMVADFQGNYISGSIHSFLYGEDKDDISSYRRIKTYIDPEGRALSLNYDIYGDVEKVYECEVSYRPRGDFESDFGKDGFLLCAFDNSGAEDTDILQLPSYISSIEYDNDNVVRVCEESDAPAALYYSQLKDRRYARWYIASGSGVIADALPTFDITFKLNTEEEQEFSLGIYSYGIHSEMGPQNWWNRRLTYSITDSSGTTDIVVENTHAGVWASFPVVGSSGSDVRLHISTNLDESANIALSAITFDPVRDSKMFYDYDHQRNLTRVTDSKGNNAINNYLYNGLLNTSTDFENNLTQFQYDDMGNVIEVLSPTGTGTGTSSTLFAYDDIAHSDITKITDPNGNETQFLYDKKRRLVKIIFPQQGYVEYDYDIMDNITVIRDSRGRKVVQYQYDSANRLTKKTFATGAEVSYEYYTNGKLKNVTDPKGNITQYEYYDNNWLKKVIFADGNQVSYEYIESGDLIKVNLPNGSSIRYEYFLDHSVKKVILPDDSTRQTAYDLYGNIRKLTDGRGNSVQFQYDVLQQMADTLIQ